MERPIYQSEPAIVQDSGFRVVLPPRVQTEVPLDITGIIPIIESDTNRS